MRPLFLALTVGLAALLPLGCARKRKERSWADDLWIQGYGYNNPNPDRIREGKKPLNFDGSVSDVQYLPSLEP